VEWTTESGQQHAQSVKLESLKGAALNEVEFYFVIRYDGTVSAAPLTLGDCLAGADAKLACDGRPAYWVGVKNLTDGKLADVVVRFGDYQVNGGHGGSRLVRDHPARSSIRQNSPTPRHSATGSGWDWATSPS